MARPCVIGLRFKDARISYEVNACAIVTPDQASLQKDPLPGRSIGPDYLFAISGYLPPRGRTVSADGVFQFVRRLKPTGISTRKKSGTRD